MKIHLNIYVIIVSAALPWTTHGQEDNTSGRNPETVGILPAARQGSIISGDESSPFGLPTQQSTKKVRSLQYSQEDTIRDILRGLKVTGIVNNGERILLGDLIVEKGKILDDVIIGQTEKVICNEITDQYLDVEFISQKRKSKKNELRLPIDLKTRVGIRLKGGQNGMAFAPLAEEELPIVFEPEDQE